MASAMDDAPLNKLIPAVPRPAEESGAEPRRKPPCAAEVHADYLARLGERVRGARARRGMTRKMLARDSGVSERYLAQLEAGQGNISIALLRQVADAMGLPLPDLVRDGEDRPIEFTLLLRRLERLAPAELAEAQRLVNARFGQERGADRAERIALVGLRGAGKSTLGRALAQRLGVPFVEMAKEIEAAAGMRIDRIFDLAGQAAYRRYERRALERVLERHGRCVIAAGGSIVSEPASYDLLLDACLTVWVQASPEEHMARVVAQGDMRPMAGNAEAMDDLRRILAERQALYAKADARLDTTGKSVDAAATELLAAIARPRAEAPG